VKRFDLYVEHYDSVELNATYYRVPRREVFEGWHRRSPPEFLFAVKANQEITHKRKLKDVGAPLARFLDAISPLREKLGPILFQLPPSLHKDLQRLDGFLSELPKGRSYCFEFRHPTWECDETYELLRRFGATHVVVSRQDFPFAEVHTSPVAYYRLHGPGKICASSYSDAWLGELAEKLVWLSERGTRCFVFFNNDIEGHAVRNADALLGHLRELGSVRAK